jgi:hypothetical protein
VKVLREPGVDTAELVDHAHAIAGRVWDQLHRNGRLDMIASVAALVTLLGRLASLTLEAPGVDWSAFRNDLAKVLRRATAPDGTAQAFENLAASMPCVSGEVLAAMLLAYAVNRSVSACDGAAALAAAAARYHELAVPEQMTPLEARDLDEHLAARANEFLAALREGHLGQQIDRAKLKINASGGVA